MKEKENFIFLERLYKTNKRKSKKDNIHQFKQSLPCEYMCACNLLFGMQLSAGRKEALHGFNTGEDGNGLFVEKAQDQERKMGTHTQHCKRTLMSLTWRMDWSEMKVAQTRPRSVNFLMNLEGPEDVERGTRAGEESRACGLVIRCGSGRKATAEEEEKRKKRALSKTWPPHPPRERLATEEDQWHGGRIGRKTKCEKLWLHRQLGMF